VPLQIPEQHWLSSEQRPFTAMHAAEHTPVDWPHTNVLVQHTELALHEP
jgi:hypothetical protein